MDKYKVLGKPTRRVDGPDKVTGQGKYTLDMAFENMAWGKVLRSPYAHARILSIDTSKAETLPGVYKVITGKDVGNILIGRRMYDVPVLAQDKVRFIGDKIAAVAAVDKDTADKAISLIEVNYEELEFVSTVSEAREKDAPVIHPNVNDYAGLPKLITGTAKNVYAHDNWEKGDSNQGFKEADIIIESNYSTPKGHQGYLEPHTCIVHAISTSEVQIWASNKAPFAMRNQLATAFNKDPEVFTINPTYIGGDFGGKGSTMDIPVCYALSLATKMPIRMAMDYTEELIAGNPRHGGEVRIKAGIKNDGTLVSWEAEAYWDSGAYAGYKPVPTANLVGAVNLAGSPYRIPNVTINSYQVYTNSVPSGHYRAPGAPQAIFASESHMDSLARAINMDPYDFRMKNMIQNGEATTTGAYLQNINAGETLELAANTASYFSEKKLHVGRGMAMADHGAPGGETTIFLSISQDGSVQAKTPLFEQGAGQYTVIQQVISEELSIDVSLISVEAQPTTSVEFDSGIGGSHTTRLAVEAAHLAGEDAKENIFRTAAELLGWQEEKLSLTEGRVENNNGESIYIHELIQRTGIEIVGKGHIQDTEYSKSTSYGAQIAEVEIDEDTGQIFIRNFTTSHDVGTIINPVSHQGQIDGGVIQAIGFALMEEVIIDESGRVANPSLAEFKIPTQKDIPYLNSSLLQNNEGSGTYNIKSAGESSNTPTAAAIANAIEDAIGIRIRDLPITSEKIYQALKEKPSSP